jgi:DNA-binding PadR family transcriptional regulator
MRTCLLLLLLEGPSHGYELLQEVQLLGLDSADAGGIYRSLRAMAHDELVTAWWEPSELGPARRTYLLTDAGRQALDVAVETAQRTARQLDALIDRFDDVTGRPT